MLDPGPAAELIAARTGSGDPAGRDAAAAVAAELGYLPLALDQAAAYIAQPRITPAAYVGGCAGIPPGNVRRRGRAGQRTIARVWDITSTRSRDRHPAAIGLLRVLACYAPDKIPRVMLGGSDDPDRQEIDEALGVLASYSMITLAPETVSIHRLLQAVLVARQPPGDDGAASGGGSPLATALDWLDQAIPDDPGSNLAGWPLLRALVPHAEKLATHFPDGDRPEMLAWIQNQIGLFRQSQGEYARALAL